MKTFNGATAPFAAQDSSGGGPACRPRPASGLRGTLDASMTARNAERRKAKDGKMECKDKMADAKPVAQSKHSHDGGHAQ